MSDLLNDYQFRCLLSFKPLIDYLSRSADASRVYRSCLGEDIEQIQKQAPELFRPIEDLSVLQRHRERVERLMSLVFPPVFRESEAVAAMIPFTGEPFFASPRFEKLFLDDNHHLRGQFNRDLKSLGRGRLIRGYLFILEQLYGIHQEFNYPINRIVPDPKTGLERHYKLEMDFSFVRALPAKGAPTLSTEQQHQVREHLTEPEILRRILPPENFELHGFVVLRAMECTTTEILLALERDLIDQEAIVSPGGFLNLQQRLRTLFGRPDLVATVAAFQDDQVLLINSGAEMIQHCIFQDSQHLPKSRFEGTPFAEAIEQNRIVRVADLNDYPFPETHDKHHTHAQSRSLMVAPLTSQGEAIGTLSIGSPYPGGLEPLDALVMEQIQPLFSMALSKALDNLENQVQRVIKEQWTAIHPTVEWRFRKATLNHLENLRRGEKAEMEPIVFDGVYPVYGVSDIRGSTDERNRAIQKDLDNHLKLALKIGQLANSARPMLILQELTRRVEDWIQRIKKGLKSGDELTVAAFLRHEIEAIFPQLKQYGPKVLRAIERYQAAVDPRVGSVYSLRKDFEESVALLNDRLAAYLDREEKDLQKIFPHYFERHRTDGVDYLIYLGQSLTERGDYSDLYLKDFRLWQLKTAAGMAWHTHQLKPALKVPLDTAHLVLVQNAPLSIRFRSDEKRFDVDGAYDTRNEIIKSRLDKAVIQGREERLTQPHKIAVVYSHPQEGLEMRRHIRFLQSAGYLTDELEALDLAAMPGVQGLKALRVGVNLTSEAISRQMHAGALG